MDNFSISLYANVQVVGLGVIDLTKHRNYSLGELINLYVPHF